MLLLSLLEVKEIIGVLAILVGLASFYPYIRSILRGETKPHLFSFIIWGIISVVVFAAQLADGGGMGAWATGASGLFCIMVAILSYQRLEEIEITRSDWVFFITSLCAIPLWLVMQSPLGSVILLTFIDVVAFFPTIRKTFDKPDEENLPGHVMGAVSCALSLFALGHYSIITVLHPLVSTISIGGFVLMALYCRNRRQRVCYG
jgi:RsiW-degrading membrane proteinase PrsW (M82 family)